MWLNPTLKTRPVRSYFIVKSGCSGHQSCQAPLRVGWQTDRSMVVQMFSAQPGRVISSTHTSHGHPEEELPSCWHACPLLPARAQGPRASASAVPGSLAVTWWTRGFTAEMHSLHVPVGGDFILNANMTVFIHTCINLFESCQALLAGFST